MKKTITLYLIVALCSLGVKAQTFQQIKSWPKEVNDRLESFFNTTLPMKERKVAVFDCDGTTFGQVPYYLADEALYQYANEALKNRKDRESGEKLSILDRMVENGRTTGKIILPVGKSGKTSQIPNNSKT